MNHVCFVSVQEMSLNVKSHQRYKYTVKRYRWDTPQKMTFLLKFYVIFVPERHFCGVSLAASSSRIDHHHTVHHRSRHAFTQNETTTQIHHTHTLIQKRHYKTMKLYAIILTLLSLVSEVCSYLKWGEPL
jgi:hypothetical protein